MKQGTKVETSVHVDAPPEKVYAAVTDITRMGEWSPETTKCVWLDGATGPAVGATFKGSNQRGMMRWSTKPTVAVADANREFAFDVNGEIRWSYRFDPDGSGTKLTESFEMLRDLKKLYAFFDRWILRVPDRRADLEQGMQQTLQRIKTAVESTP